MTNAMKQTTTIPLELISHPLCPYVQRPVISLTEKGVAFRRTDVDLANKPGWFLALSPLGKTPVLNVAGRAIFESAVILEYLEETQPNPLHPADPLQRAEHRSWIEFGSAILNDIAGFYSAQSEEAFAAATGALAEKFARVEGRVKGDPWFAGDRFSLVDATFGPIFRYFDTFDEIDDFGVLADKPNVARWRRQLASRRSIVGAAPVNYPERLRTFLRAKNSALSRRM